VLVVEDEIELRELVAAVLAAEGYRPVSAPHGAAALALLEAARRTADAGAELILLDLHPPGVDGEEFVARYRRTPGPHAPIVLGAAVSGAEAVALAERLGAAGFVRKPFDFDALLGVVAAAVCGPAPAELVPAPRPRPAAAPAGRSTAGWATRVRPKKVREEWGAAERRRLQARLRADVARVREASARVRAETERLATLEAVRRLTAAEAAQVTRVRRESEALHLELALLRDEFERLRAG
jgi:CheY-like chemotaxis protein